MSSKNHMNKCEIIGVVCAMGKSMGQADYWIGNLASSGGSDKTLDENSLSVRIWVWGKEDSWQNILMKWDQQCQKLSDERK